MAKRQKINWYEVDKTVSGLETNVEHELDVQREAIPLVFVPGIMGTCLRRAGTDGSGKGADGLPNMRWNPSSAMWMLWYVSGTSGAERKAMLVGDRFDANYLEPNNANPPGDGFAALMEDYCKKFLTPLKVHDWGPLGKIFEFPVYAVGYNWTDDAKNAGTKLAARIKEIIAEAKDVVGLCEKVILITHSMGGLVSRAASELAGASGSILGIVHGVQPALGAPAAYWRIKAGFEGFGMTSRVLGSSGEKVTPVLGNIPGGLELLPNKLHRTNAGARQWLTVTENGVATLAFPKADPYKEIYKVKAVVKPKAGEKPSQNAYWGLVDPNLLDPGNVAPEAPNARDRMDASTLSSDPWAAFLTTLDVAERFHDALGKKTHSRTFCVRGVGHKTADVIEMRVESNWVRSDPYPARGFRGFFTNAKGKSMQAVLQDPAGDGDATVVRSSAVALDAPGKQMPGDRAIEVEHQPAYENADVQAFAIEAIVALCKMRYEDRRHPLGDFPAPGAGTT
jgi:hypothetical protein